MENKEIDELVDETLKQVEKEDKIENIVEIKNNLLSKKGKFASFMIKMKELKVEEKKEFGQIVNSAKAKVEKAINDKMADLEAKKLAKELEKEAIDITLPGYDHSYGTNNPFYDIIKEMEDIFIGMGYTVEDGPEIESDKYNFELLNIPKDHPARDMQDSFFINENTLLRTQTSAVQVHTMEKSNGKPIKIICPGKCYRRDDDDMTHSHQFAQIEGLVIDKNINMGNLKGTLELFAKKMFSKDSKIRFRSSYFPFTEPSVEVDISCFKCNGKGCPTCKNSGWIEVLGAGMVHPNVLKMSGYDPEIYSGFAFGIGIDRVAMLRYGIDDIRRIYTNDIRFLKCFSKKVED
ncbi:MAG: phenylalanine--tRNA ligase subunit alpha [Bacilli bacterium]